MNDSQVAPPEDGQQGVPVIEKVTGILFKEKNRTRIVLLAVSSALLLLSLLVVCLMPGPRYVSVARDEIIERRVIQVLCASLVAICPIAAVGVCLKHPSVNNAIVMFVSGVGSGCVCGLSFAMIIVNILLTLFDIIRGKFRLDFMEMFAINVLVTALTVLTYAQTSLSKQLYEVYCEAERNTSSSVPKGSAVQVIGGSRSGATNGRAAKSSVKSSKTSGSYDLSSVNYDNNFY